VNKQPLKGNQNEAKHPTAPSDPAIDLNAITLFEVIQAANKQDVAFDFEILSKLDKEGVLHHTCTATEVKDIMSGVLAHHRITDAPEHIVTNSKKPWAGPSKLITSNRDRGRSYGNTVGCVEPFTDKSYRNNTVLTTPYI